MPEAVHQGGSPSAMATVITVTAGSTGVLLNANPLRNAFTIQNGGASVLWINFGAVPAASTGLPVGTGAQYYNGDYTGTVTAFGNGGPAFILDVG